MGSPGKTEPKGGLRLLETNKLQDATQQLLSLAGIRINGDNPWDIRVHDQKFHQRVLAQGSLGLGESYMDGWWDCERLDEFFTRVTRAQLPGKIKKNRHLIYGAPLARALNMQSKKRAFLIGEKHYDLGNTLFVNMLDNRMVYSCAYWENNDMQAPAYWSLHMAINPVEPSCLKRP
jgi:cyclopropane-fatty-acyl-phospholipid synthase